MWELDESIFTDFKGKIVKKCKNTLDDYSRNGDILVTVTPNN